MLLEMNLIRHAFFNVRNLIDDFNFIYYCILFNWFPKNALNFINITEIYFGENLLNVIEF